MSESEIEAAAERKRRHREVRVGSDEWADYCSRVAGISSEDRDNELLADAYLARLAADRAEREERETTLGNLLQEFRTADDERLAEVHDRDAEADKWKAEGDMYGWNFHKGMASGCTTASIIFSRVGRAIKKQLDLLRVLKGGPQ